MPETAYPLTWELDSLFDHPESQGFQDRFSEFHLELERGAWVSESLPTVTADAGSVQAWVEFLQKFEMTESLYQEVYALIGCHAAADADNTAFQQWEARLAALDPLRQQMATNLEFALQEADPEQLEQFLAADEWLKRNAFFVGELTRNSALRFPKAQETLAAELGVDGIHAWGRLYDRLSSALRITVMQRGELVEKSPGQVQFDMAERTVRQNNFYAADKAWQSIADTCADALNHISGTRLTRYRRLGLQDHLVAPLRYNRMQRATLDTMWSVVTERKHVLVDYLQRKAQILGLDALAWYDLQAPLPRGSQGDPQLDYQTACDLVIHTFDGFSGELGDFARRAIDQRWIEVEDRPGKRQGGFCTGFPLQKQSRIFMTFTNSPDSMSTLAHELGHAYHSYVLRDQPLLLQEYPMNLAETASTFAEAVLGDQRLESARETQQQLVILDTMLSDSVSFLMNIHARYVFENQFHLERMTGELTADRLSELMLAAQQETYLDALDDAGWNPHFWISKLHFYISQFPFYNFPYTFGYLLSLGVYALSGDLGDEFPDQYKRLLLATGCQQTEDAVQSTLGYDLTDGDFWHRSLDIVEQRVQRFLELSS